MQAQPLSISYFGKIPSHGDFVRHHATSYAWRTLDDWVQQGMRYVMLRNRGMLRPDSATPLSFVFTPPAGAARLVGTLVHSHDRTGRFYPFIVAAEQPTASHEADVAHLPVQQAPFFAQSAQVACEAVRTLDAHTLSGRVQHLHAAPALDAATLLSSYLHHTTFKALAEQVWGHFDDSRKYLLLKNLLDILTPFREQPGLPMSLGLRFSLGEGTHDAHLAGFWWMLAHRMAGQPQATPTCFWGPFEAASRSARALLLFMQPPPPKAFGALLPDGEDNDAVFDLERAGLHDAAGAALALPPHYGRLIESETLTLADLLAQV